jgi:hypothetical protein
MRSLCSRLTWLIAGGLLLAALVAAAGGEEMICRTGLLTDPIYQKGVLLFFSLYETMPALASAMVKVTALTLGSPTWLARDVGQNTEGVRIKDNARSLSCAVIHLIMLGAAFVGTVWKDADDGPVSYLATVTTGA